MTGWLFLLGGGAAGAAQAGLLARAVRAGAGPASLLARLSLAGAVLLVAARSRELAAGVAGWGAGYAIAGALLVRRFR